MTHAVCYTACPCYRRAYADAWELMVEIAYRFKAQANGEKPTPRTRKTQGALVVGGKKYKLSSEELGRLKL